MSWFFAGLSIAFSMFWETFWALVLGFAISAVLQVFVSKERMSRAFGQTNLKTMLFATALGAASSSCSYAAVAASRSAIKQGAALIPALAFMFASTNLVVELGAMLWALMGWHFVLAEVLGAFVLIGCMWLLAKIFLPPTVEREARQNAVSAQTIAAGCCADDEVSDSKSDRKVTALANAFLMDWRMIWKELAIGFLIAGFLAALVPPSWWRALFLQNGAPSIRLVENALVAPIIAGASFICSCANIPLANVLWTNGISFGGVISFIYADLLAIPLILIYAKYYGIRATAFIVGIFYVSMVVAGIVVDVVFAACGLIPVAARAAAVTPPHTIICWNYTTWLNILAMIAVGSLLMIQRRRAR